MSWHTDSHGRHFQDRQKTIFSPAKNEEAGREIHIDTVARADQSVEWLNREWEQGGRERKVHLVEYANEAANRAGIIGGNKRVSGPQREEAGKVHSVYRRWVDTHKGEE